ncbi:MAG: thioesterase family protein [Acidobacteriota bacterium]|nr:MAG: thioesterase family protein [Acidobacteriota bacterium]
MDRVTFASDFPVVFETPVAWGEMDSMGHVNNIVYFRYFESARLAYFERVGFLDEMKRSGVGPILATTQCRFRKPLTYPDHIRIGATARDLREDRFTMLYCIESEALGTIAADGEGLIVAYDYNKRSKVAVPDSVRRAILDLEAG